MGNWTIDQINGVLVYLMGLVGVLTTVYTTIKKGIDKGFKPINDKIDKVDMNSTKNYLVARISDIKQGQVLDDISRERFIEQYDHYVHLKGNSYITLEVEKLKKEGKI
jgi:hypothetical protein